MFTFDSKHTRSRYKIRAQQQRETLGVVNRRQFGANYIPMISFHSQAPHVQGHFEIWKQVFTYDEQNAIALANNSKGLDLSWDTKWCPVDLVHFF